MVLIQRLVKNRLPPLPPTKYGGLMNNPPHNELHVGGHGAEAPSSGAFGGHRKSIKHVMIVK